jgi:hypothetical protein
MSNYETKTAPNAMDFLGSYLKKEDVLQPTVVEIIDIYVDEMPDEDGTKLVAKFAEFSRPMVLNKTNIKRLCKMFGTVDTSQWRGSITLYVDQNIEFGGRIVGGLRVRPAQANGPAIVDEESKRRFINEEDFI